MKSSEKSARQSPLPLERNLVHHFLRIVNGLNIKLAEKIRVLNVNLNQFRVLQILYERDGLIISELRDLCVITQPVFSRVLQQVESRKLVKRTQDDDDKRAYRIWLTPRGVATYEAAVPFAQQVHEDMCKGLNGAEINRLIEAIAMLDRRVNAVDD